ncbi:MAG: NifB/NifX family molybdenum-iron cluster-binding protein [Bacteroidales bacterium]|nr:ATPase [Lentimicrobiaceae bacterium]MDD5695544.1 NifB/NifX family molybdenum-iron cluster-binding protein [Bacteroidales bacterium]
MNKRIAIPLENGVLCPHFGHCQAFAIVTVENNVVTEMNEVTPPEHIPGLYPRWIAQFGVTDVIAGGMGQQAIMLFNQQKINAFVGAPIKPAVDLVNDFLADRLNLSANYCDHGSQHEHGHYGH